MRFYACTYGMYLVICAAAMETTQNTLMTTEEVAAYLRRSVRSIQDLCRSGRMPYIKVGGQYRFRLSDIDTWLEDNTVQPQSA